MDVITAFLNAGIIEEIYIRQPEGFEQRGPNGEELVCRFEQVNLDLNRRHGIGTRL
jgi:hypothetical protein